jgi:hypothetical protein
MESSMGYHAGYAKFGWLEARVVGDVLQRHMHRFMRGHSVLFEYTVYDI